MSKPSIDSLFGESARQSFPPDLLRLAAEVIRRRAKHDHAKQVEQAWSKSVRAAESALLQLMSSHGLKTITLDDGSQVTAAEKHYFALPKNNEEALTWLRRIGAGEFLDVVPQDKPLRDFLRARIERGLPHNPLVKDTVLRTLRIVKPKDPGLEPKKEGE